MIDVKEVRTSVSLDVKKADVTQSVGRVSEGRITQKLDLPKNTIMTARLIDSARPDPFFVYFMALLGGRTCHFGQA